MLTPSGELPLTYKATMGKGLCIVLPDKMPFSTMSVIKIEKRNILDKEILIKD
jgi:hypothetical protein